MAQQSVTGIFHQIKYLIEPFCTSVIRIRYDRRVMGQTKLRQSPDFAHVFRRAFILNERQVVLVHHQNQVVMREVSFNDLPRPQI